VIFCSLLSLTGQPTYFAIGGHPGVNASPFPAVGTSFHGVYVV